MHACTHVCHSPEKKSHESVEKFSIGDEKISLCFDCRCVVKHLKIQLSIGFKACESSSHKPIHLQPTTIVFRAAESEKWRCYCCTKQNINNKKHDFCTHVTHVKKSSAIDAHSKDFSIDGKNIKLCLGCSKTVTILNLKYHAIYGTCESSLHHNYVGPAYHHHDNTIIFRSRNHNEDKWRCYSCLILSN